MSEFKPGHDPVVWRLIEGLIISLLIVFAFVAALGSIIVDAVKKWWNR